LQVIFFGIRQATSAVRSHSTFLPLAAMNFMVSLSVALVP